MNSLLVCPKSRGNSFRIARHIADNTESDLMILNQNPDINLQKYTTVILCSGVYGGKVHNTLMKWLSELEKNQFNPDTHFELLLTWFGRGHSDQHASNKVKTLLEKKDILIDSDYIACYGGKLFIRPTRPNKEDYDKILSWAKSKM